MAFRFDAFGAFISQTMPSIIASADVVRCSSLRRMNSTVRPAAASASIGFSSTLPITAISVSEISGSAIPAIMAGIARRLISLKLTEVFKIGFDSANVS